MKYFTKEELEDITKELLENPTRETLKKLNEKYNGKSEERNILVKSVPNVNIEPPVVGPIATSSIEEKTVVVPMPPVEEEKNVVNPIPNFNIPSMEIPKTENVVNNNVNIPNMPSFELPKLETPVFNNQNNEPVSFSGNLWDAPKTEVSNLMQTTDNFSAVNSIMPTTEVPITGAPFFGPSLEPVNNPIPINNAPVKEPTMFGQMQQNYM